MKQYNEWGKDLNDSVKAIKTIQHTVLPKLISGSLHNIEKSSNEILLWMDIYSGIDMIRKNKNGLQGVACRVQFGPAYNTFTIRSARHTGAKTEFEKRTTQIEAGYFYPAFTLHAYFDDRIYMNLLSIAVIKTIDLYKAIRNGVKMSTRYSDNQFKVVKWADLIDYGILIITTEQQPIQVEEIKKPIKAEQLNLFK